MMSRGRVTVGGSKVTSSHSRETLEEIPIMCACGEMVK